MADFAYFADQSDEEFREWLSLMLPLVGAPQCRVFTHMRRVELERRKQSSETQSGDSNA